METVGNFLIQPNKDFPLDCETLSMLQKNAAMTAVIGNMAGDKVILTGCELSDNGMRRDAGYVFVRTVDYPDGEVLRWEGGVVSGGMYLRQEDMSVNAHGYEYPKAYTRRSLAPGVGRENFSWDDFKRPKTPAELESLVSGLSEKVTDAETRNASEPLGIVKMWASVNVPDGYVLCNGQELSETEYPELHEALGAAFNKAVSATGVPYTTRNGYFRVPDLRGRFIAGQHDSDPDYSAAGNAGGKKTVTLTTEQLPEHGHDVKDYLMIPDGLDDCTVGTWTVDGKQRKVGASSVSGNKARAQTNYNHKNNIQWVEHPTEYSGAGSAHENRPPYYVLAYIMKAK